MMAFFHIVFLEVLERSIAVTYVIAVILLVRFLLQKFPKKYSYALWSIAGLRLLFDFRLSSVVSLFNFVSSPAVFPAQLQNDYRITRLNAALQAENAIPPAAPNVPEVSAGSADYLAILDGLLSVFCLLWLAGILFLLLHTAVSYIKIKKSVATAIKCENNIYECSNLPSPFVIGLFSPKIYLPFRLDASEKRYILEHETYHIKRKDPIIKLFAFLLLSVFWFHPLLWYSYYLFVQDMEMSCDEAVLRRMGNEIKQEYSDSLLSFAKGKSRLTMGPLSFGESDAGKRIKNVLRFKKPKVWVGIAGILIIGIIAIVCLTNGSAATSSDSSEESFETAGTDTVLTDETTAESSEEDSILPAAVNEADIYAAANAWAQAFVSRDGNTLAKMASAKVKEDLSLEERSDGSYDFGWSSPWPFGEPSYTLLDITETSAYILYYAYTSDPHVTVWTETLALEPSDGAFSVVSEELRFHDAIRSGAEFANAYPNGINDSGIDYIKTGLGETLNKNALSDSSGIYRSLFEPETALTFLLNLSDNPDEVTLELLSDESVDGIQKFRAAIHFLTDNTTVNVSIMQPYGTAGIWVPQDYTTDPLARFMAMDWDDIRARNLSLTEEPINWQDIVCIGELPEYDIKIYGYNDGECFGKGVAVEIGDRVSYLDWYYTSARGLLPDFYWKETEKQLQAALNIYTGTGAAAQELHVLQQSDTGALTDSVFDMTQYTELLANRLTFEYDRQTGRLTLFDKQYDTTLASINIPAPEADIASLEAGSISGFELGSEITFYVTPGYLPEGWVICEYENMPVLEAPVILSYNADNELTFSLGKLRSR